MTLKKKSSERSRSYDTFEESSNSNPGGSIPQKSDKAHGVEAQRLASEGFWADDQDQQPAGSRPHAMGIQTEARHHYQEDPLDPPPIYTPSESTATSTPPSPVVARAQPQPVGEPPSPTSPSCPTIPEENEQRLSGDGSYASSPLLERAEPQAEPPTQRAECMWNHDAKKHKRRRFRKACWFMFALALCLWLMIPGMSKAHTRQPGWHHRPSDNLDQSPVPSWPVPRREYRQHETSSAITGTFKLYDLLDLSTTSGSIVVTIDPQPGDKPAVLKVQTQSGAVRIRMGGGSIIPWLPSSDETNRTFETEINTQSGSVTGSLLAGNGGATQIETRSGSISVTLHMLDLGPEGQTSSLRTYSQSGAQVLQVASSSSDDLRNLEAEHIARGSASLKIDYPKRWLGQLHMKSEGSGSMVARGSNLEFEQDGNKEKYAYRGKGDLKQVEIIAQGSGSAVFSC